MKSPQLLHQSAVAFEVFICYFILKFIYLYFILKMSGSSHCVLIALLSLLNMMVERCKHQENPFLGPYFLLELEICIVFTSLNQKLRI